MRSPWWIVLTFTLLGVVIAGKIIHKDPPKFEDLTPFEQFMVETSLIQSMMKSPDWNKMTEEQQHFAVHWIHDMLRGRVPQWYRLGG